MKQIFTGNPNLLKNPTLMLGFGQDKMRQELSSKNNPIGPLLSGFATEKTLNSIFGPPGKKRCDMIPPNVRDQIFPRQSEQRTVQGLIAVVNSLVQLVAQLSQKLEQLVGGAKGASVSGTSAGSSSIPKDSVLTNAPAGFLWKPKSDSTGNLAILTPPSLAHSTVSCKIYSPDGKLIDTGKWAGHGNPKSGGERLHFRFGKQGGSYPPGSIVEFAQKDGSMVRIKIANTGKRTEGR